MFARLAALALLAITAAGCATPPPDNPGNACLIFEDNRSWYRATDRAERKWGTSKALQLAIIRQESSFQHDARPPRKRFLFVFPGSRLSSARGYPQALDGTWDTYRTATGNRGAKRQNFADAADFVAWYVHTTSARTGVPQGDAYAQYIAYHEGPNGLVMGTHRTKPALKQIAGRVAYVAQTYETQLNSCERQFRRGIPFIPLI